MAHALMDWETLDKFQIDELMQGTIAPPEPEMKLIIMSIMNLSIMIRKLSIRLAGNPDWRFRQLSAEFAISFSCR